MEAQIESAKRLVTGGRSVGIVASGYALARIKRMGTYTASSRELALVHVEAILARGNYAAMINVGGQFVVKELVLA